MTLRSNSVKRSGRRRARRVSAGMNEDVLATDSGVFEAWSRRLDWYFTINTHSIQKKFTVYMEEYLPNVNCVTLQPYVTRGLQE